MSTVESEGATVSASLSTSMKRRLLPMGRHRVGALAAADLGLERLVLHLELPRLGGAPADGDQLVVGEGLLDVVEGALVDGADGRLQRGLRGHQDDRQGGVHLLCGEQDLQAAHAGHAHVGQEHVGADVGEALQPLAPADGGAHLEALALEEDAQGVQDRGLVVDDEDLGCVAHWVLLNACGWAARRARGARGGRRRRWRPRPRRSGRGPRTRRRRARPPRAAPARAPARCRRGAR